MTRAGDPEVENGREEGRDTPGSESDEGHKERVDRELIELLNELRVALPGVQVLFAFLLTIPFSQGFLRITSLERTVYAATLLLSAAASALLIAPSSYHRLHFRSGNKERILFTSNRLTIAGLLALAGALTCAVYLVMSYVFDSTMAVVVAVATALVFGWLWYGLPLARRKGEN
ncbi:MAG: hypothetical protein H0U16_08105 [Actinobacteria bacterium]|nr:hypothetical protein [Actinomycetota bacterium]